MDDLEDIFKHAKYAYHITSIENSKSIKSEGLKSNYKNKPSSSDIINIMNELGFNNPFKFDRSNVSYFKTNSNCLKNVQEYVNKDLKKSVVIINVENIQKPVYIANMSFISDLIDYKYGGSDVMMHADTPQEAIDNYKRSIKEVTSSKDIEGYDICDEKNIELIVDGDIPSENIVKVLS